MSEDVEPVGPVEVGDAIVDGRFQLLSDIGLGGSAVVYRALDLATNEAVALKVSRLPVETDKQLLHQYQKMRRLHSPHIVVCLGYFLHRVADVSYSVLSLELVDGIHIRDFVATASLARRFDVARLIALALDELAVVGLRHGDVWAENILVRNEVPVLIDPDSDGPGSALLRHSASDLTRFVDLLVVLGLADEPTQQQLRGCEMYGRPFLACAELLRTARVDAFADDRKERFAALRAAYAHRSSTGEGRYAALVTGRRAAFAELVRRVEDALAAVDVSFPKFDQGANVVAEERELKGALNGLGELTHLGLTYPSAHGRVWDLFLRSHTPFAKPSPFGEPSLLGLVQSTVRFDGEVPEVSDVIGLRSVENAIVFSLETPYGWVDLPDDWDVRTLEALLGLRIPAFPSCQQLQGPKQDPVAHGVDTIQRKLAEDVARWLGPLVQGPAAGQLVALRKIFETQFRESWATWFASVARFDLVLVEQPVYLELDALLADHAVTRVTWRFPFTSAPSPPSSQ
jgi:hypothetical protein